MNDNMNDLNEEEKRHLLPAYSIETIEKHMVNPYREFANYCLDNLYPTTEGATNKSLIDFVQLAKSNVDAATDLLSKKLLEFAPNMTLRKSVSAWQNNTVLLLDVILSGTSIGTINFYTSNAATTSKEVVSAELTLFEFDGFDFLEMNRKMNVYIFCKNESDNRVIDLMLSFLCGLGNFLEFVRAYKAKQLVTKNIDMFVKKFVEPYVLNTIVQFNQDGFMIAALCGEKILRQNYGYKDYLKSIKEFGDEIQRLYGDKFKSIKEAAQKKNNNE